MMTTKTQNIKKKVVQVATIMRGSRKMASSRLGGEVNLFRIDKLQNVKKVILEALYTF